MFIIEDKVWDVRHGWGTVTKIEESGRRPVMVGFNDGTDFYTKEGKSSVYDNSRCLLFDELHPTKKSLSRSKQRVECDQLYYFVNCTGEINSTTEKGTLNDEKLYEANNYFLTFTEAKKSKIYKAFN
ncbi:MAG: hypothetical protein ACRC0V_10950 [Fusobacteriaceae bacterium]